MSTKETTIVNGGAWSSTAEPKIPMHYMHVEMEWLEKALGTSPNNKDILGEYIASKAPDAKSMEEEIAAIGTDGVMDKQLCVYPKGTFLYDTSLQKFEDTLDSDIEIVDEKYYRKKSRDDVTNPRIYEKKENMPFYYNYQLRGFFKDSCGLLSKAEDTDENGKKSTATESSKIKAYKKVVDGCIFVFPRRIPIEIPDFYLDDDGVTMIPSRDENGNLRIVQRCLRTSGPSGERVAIAASEMIPAGSRIRFTIGMTSLKFKPAIIEWLNYAAVHGLSGWRNSGLGICRWREIDERYLPYTVDKSED